MTFLSGEAPSRFYCGFPTVTVFCSYSSCLPYSFCSLFHSPSPSICTSSFSPSLTTHTHTHARSSDSFVCDISFGGQKFNWAVGGFDAKSLPLRTHEVLLAPVQVCARESVLYTLVCVWICVYSPLYPLHSRFRTCLCKHTPSLTHSHMQPLLLALRTRTTSVEAAIRSALHHNPV